MSKNVTIAGTNYNDVPSIEIPLQTSGTASFFDVSDTTATASDVASGKYFYTSAGVKTAGTGSGGGTTVYTSSTGLLYTAVMTINIGMESASGNTLASALNRFGTMEYLEELTITGIGRNNSANTLLVASTAYFTVAKFPRLKKVAIQPTEIRNSSGSNYDPVRTYFTAGHYVFNNSNLQEVVLGKLGGPYWAGGGYYRNKDENGNSTNTIGSTVGLTLKVYTNQYRAKGGFGNGNLASNTTVIEYDYTTGEILTQ